MLRGRSPLGSEAEAMQPSPDVEPAVESARRSRPLRLPQRPPGAMPESQFRALCTNCGDCARVCPHGSVVMTDRGPSIESRDQPCFLCADRPCISACSSGALGLERTQKMGRAQIVLPDCLSQARPDCVVCLERCPVEGAIQMDSVLGKPIVDNSLCLGCGVCLYVCPAPRNAVILVAEDRV